MVIFLGSTGHLHCGLLQFDAALLITTLACKYGNIFKHFLAAVTKSGSLDGTDLKT